MSSESIIDFFPRENIGIFPTPVRMLELDSGKTFWIKDDGSCGCVYGGNKVRKLEYLLPHIAQLGKKKLIVQGDAESHTVTACVVYGRKVGFDVIAVVFPYKNSLNAGHSIEMLKELGADVIKTGNMLSMLFAARLLAVSPAAFLVPMGATTPISTLGYVNAAFELAEQIERGHLPDISRIYISFATGGTVAGLLVGLALADLPIKVVAVQATENMIGNMRSLRMRVAEVLKLMGRGDMKAAAMDRLEMIDAGFLGGGYRAITKESEGAAAKLKAKGLCLDLAFTAKTMAALLAHVNEDSGENILFWNTHDQEGKLK